ncbi:MAG: hypothetical protein HY976_02475 [Candidatus Kerfeldbacteria bacterium]|nr:hypothetical protein [Candidatus Kerfeldbacteria bacterium]
MPRKTAVQEADAMLPKEVRKGVQDTRRRMDENIAVERAMQESRELSEQRARDRKLVEEVIAEVTGEQIGNAGMTNRDMTRSRMAKYTRTPVRRAEAAPTEEQPTSEPDTEQEAA